MIPSRKEAVEKRVKEERGCQRRTISGCNQIKRVGKKVGTENPAFWLREREEEEKDWTANTKQTVVRVERGDPFRPKRLQGLPKGQAFGVAAPCKAARELFFVQIGRSCNVFLV